MSKEILWTPSSEVSTQSNLRKFITWLKDRGHRFDDYHSLWTWSITKQEEFWALLLEYFQVDYSGTSDKVLSGVQMPGVKWFEGISLSYAEQVFKHESETRPAIIFASETKAVVEISWAELRRDVAAVASFLREAGVTPGDRVAAFLPCCPEATVAFLAANSVGAVWSSCSPDFGVQAVLDRFVQIEPKVLVACVGYSYGGRYFDKREVVQQLRASLPSVKKVLIIDNGDDIATEDKRFSEIRKRAADLSFTRVAFSHPIWVVFSSGTTGLPKAITHSVGGILLEHLKYLTFHNDLKEGERLFWYTTTGWMMWNYIQSTLLCGATMVFYDGSPAFPDMGKLWKFCDEARINHFGTSAGFILACKKEGIVPSSVATLKDLRSIGSTGSTLPPEGFEWVYQNVKANLWLASMSGGTDMCTAFVGGNPMWPVHKGEIQCRALGCSLFAWNDEGHSVTNQVGEMVITRPMPSMPIYFWNDPHFAKYKESYFEMYPGVWRHGDWIEITEHNGVIIYGRSDATLNRGGVRIGTSEIYRSVDKVSEVKDALMICIEKGNGEFYMPLFVVMNSDHELNPDIVRRLNQAIRADNTPRHVPDEIVAVPDIPYTISGKKTETPVKKILMGKDPAKVINAGSLRNPESLNFFAAFRNKMKP